MKEYNCKICGWGPDEQKSHYDSHLKSKKHIDKVVIQKLKNAIKSGDKNIIEQIKNEPITDYKSMNQEQLLQLCKDKDIPYLTHNKKPYAKNNLIKRLQNCDSNGGKYVPDEKKSKKPLLRLPGGAPARGGRKPDEPETRTRLTGNAHTARVVKTRQTGTAGTFNMRIVRGYPGLSPPPHNEAANPGGYHSQ